MMPTSPRSPYHSVRRVFPSTAGRLACQAGPSRIVRGLSLLPAYACCRPVCRRPSCTAASKRVSRTAPGRRPDDAPPWRVGCPPPQGPSLGSGLCCPGPSSLNRPHPPHSPAHRDFTAGRLIRDAFAVRERRGDPRVVPGFRWACRKLWRRPQDGLCPTPVSHFVNLWKTEAEREQPVLLAHGPRAGKAEALAQPQHGFEPLDGPSRRVEGLEAAHPRHGPLDPEVIALDPLLEMFGHVVDRGARQEPVFLGCRDDGWVGPRPIGADPVRGEERLVFQRLAKEPLGRVEIA